jgi:elongation factor G
MKSSDGMKSSHRRIARPRSAALIGLSRSGKSALYENLMAMAGAPINRQGDHRPRTAIGDVVLGHCNFLGDPWSLLDCPCATEFPEETKSALSVVDFAVVVCEPPSADARELQSLFSMLENRGIPHLVFINKIDTRRSSEDEPVKALQVYSSRPLVQRQMPIYENDVVTGYVDVIKEKAYRYHDHEGAEEVSLPKVLQRTEEQAHHDLAEMLVHHDPKAPGHQATTSQEIFGELHDGQSSGVIVEVLLGSADRGDGILPLWKALRHDGPDPLSAASTHHIEPDGEVLVEIFKTSQDPHIGVLSYGRVWRGSIKEDGTIGGRKIGGLYRLPGGETAEIAEAHAGELVAIAQIDGFAAGTILTPGGIYTFGAHASECPSEDILNRWNHL